MVVHGPYPIGEPRVAREVRVALEEGFDVDVVAMRRSGEIPLELVDGARVFRLPLIHRRGASAFGVIREYVGFAILATLVVAKISIRQRYDIVQVHNPPDFLVVAGVAPKLFGSKLIFDVHDLAPEMYAMRFDNRRGAHATELILRSIERAAIGIADAVITVHEPYRDELVKRGADPGKISVVMNTVDECLLPKAGPQVHRDGFRVFYHGTITPPYGIHLLIEAAAIASDQVPDLEVEICGEGDEVAYLQVRASELGIRERVHLSGAYLPQKEAVERAASASVGVIPNLPIALNSFALSSKLFEYVALGVPVVSAALPTIKAHFSDEELLFFEPGNADALAEALTAVSRDPAAAAARADAARRRYADYRWPVQAHRYARVLASAKEER